MSVTAVWPASWTRADLGRFVALGALLAAVRAFGTSDAAWDLRWIYWLSVMVLGGLVYLLVFDGLRTAFPRLPRVALETATAVLAAGPISLVVHGWGALIFGFEPTLAGLLRLPPSVLSVGLVIGALRWASSPPARPEPLRRRARPALSARLPFALQGADILALEAEDHFVRVHTRAGAALVYLRLSDAIAQVEPVEGLRVHRSWWVARDAVVAAAWRRGRGGLRLANGLEAPVSAAYAKEARRIL